jgi:hypothetical protein
MTADIKVRDITISRIDLVSNPPPIEEEWEKRGRIRGVMCIKTLTPCMQVAV